MQPALAHTLKISSHGFAAEAVSLIPMDRSHVDALWQAAQFPEIWQWAVVPMTSRDDMARYVDTALATRDRGTEFPFVVIDRASGQVIGSTRYMDIQLENRGLEIGHTWYTPRVWRTRVNSECKYLLLLHAFEVLGLMRVQLKTDLRNTRSQSAIARLGAQKEGVLRKKRLILNGYPRSDVYFSILDEEWPGVKARLEGFLAR